MYCINCEWDGRCDGAVCYYDWLREQRMAMPDYDEKKYYMVDEIGLCAYRQSYSMREVDEFEDENPNCETIYFKMAEDIERDSTLMWEDDERWHMRGRESAWCAIKKQGLSAVYGQCSKFVRDDFKFRIELGFYDEVLRLVRRVKKRGMLSGVKL